MPGARNSQATMSDVAKTPASTVTLTGSSSTVLAANDARVEVFIANNSATDAYLALGPTAVSGSGIYLKAAGGSTVINSYTGIITGIGNTATLAFAEV